ncbi:DUF2279 domain-containing protein [Foetidibacter luteolus]|uniref:DUF2279 domain-containing protein n=1 Tax=Foetidibacter luteolus TaxID=2608880 RepID=UPI00129B1A64|nr:DUF2279 domain-containing protein [Foetidibacter luteolus]
MNKWIVAVLVLVCEAVTAQQLQQPAYTLPLYDSATFKQDIPASFSPRLAKQPPFSKKTRLYTVSAANITAFTALTFSLYNTWYNSYNQTGFHFFNDMDEWLQVDKMGHSYSAYTIARLNMNMWQWAGVPHKKSVWLGAFTGTAFLTMVEVYDGFSSGWGWSWGDFAANVTGPGLLVGQELLWQEQRISFKFSFHKKNYGSPVLNQRADDIYGNKLSERMLKDYNGQTYWLSANLHSFFRNSGLPRWLNIAAGYGADNMFGARPDSWKDASGNPIYLTGDLKRYRQFYIAPDIDLTRIKTRSKWLRTTFSILNSVKFPAPSVEFSRGKVSWNWLHF